MNQPSLEEYVKGMESHDFSEYAPAIISVNNANGDLDIVKQAVKESQKLGESGKKVISLTNYFDQNSRVKVFEEYGIKDPNSIVLEYQMNKLTDDKEKQLFYQIKSVEMQGGIEHIIKSQLQSAEISDLEKDQKATEIKNQYKQMENQYKELDIDKKTKLSENEGKQLSEEVNNMRKLTHAVNTAVTRYQAEGLAKVINENKDDIQFIINSGNQENELMVHELYQLLDDDKSLIDANKTKGIMKLGGELNIAFAGNCYGIMNPLDQLMYSQEEVQQLYPQMIPAGVEQDLNKEKMSSLKEEDLKQSLNYLRITNNGNEKDELDVLILNSELGKPIKADPRYKDMPIIDDKGIAYLATKQMSKNGKIVAGLIPESSEGENQYGVYTVRSNLNVVRKKGEKLEHKMIDTEMPKEINYDMGKIKEYVGIIKDEINKSIEEYQKTVAQSEQQDLPKAA